MYAFHSTLHIAAACALPTTTAVGAARDLPLVPDVAQRPPRGSLPIRARGPHPLRAGWKIALLLSSPSTVSCSGM